MSVEAIRLKNFMAFQDTDWIELRPITLLFGKNSSGKSIIGRALRLLKQNLGAEAGSGPFVYAARRGVDVADFGTMIHVSPGSPAWPKPVIFAFRCRLVDTLDVLIRLVNQQRRREGLPEISARQAHDQVELCLQYEWNDELEQAWLTELEITYPQPHTEGQPGLIVFAAYRLDYRAAIEGEDEWGFHRDVWWFHSDILHGHEVDRDSAWAGARIDLVSGFLPSLATPEGVLSSGTASSDDLQFAVALLRELRQTVEQFLRRTDYLGPLRPEPEREFVFDAQRIRDWRGSGLRGYLRYLRGEVDQSMIDEVDDWLQAIGLCYYAHPATFYSFRDRALVASVNIHELEEEEPKNLADVGFGLPQVLPVIIQCLLPGSDSTLLIEQPELHLHPSAQAELGDLFIQTSNRGIRLLIETHSEHLLLRMRRRIAETAAEKIIQDKRLSSQNLTVYFVDRAESTSFVELVEITRLGGMAKLPQRLKDFFSDDLKEMVELTDAALQVKSQKGKTYESGS